MDFIHVPHRFWDWFRKNHHLYLRYLRVSVKERHQLAAMMLERLHVHCEHLSFVIFDGPDDPRLMLAITAKGNPDYFEDAEAVTDYAPYELKDWKFYNLIPPWNYYALPVGYYYNNIALLIDNIWFKPIHHPGDPSILAFTIYLKFYKKRQHKLPYLKQAVKELLYKYLGEKIYTLDVRYFELAQLPGKPAKKGLQELYEMPTYIDWHKTKKLKYSEN